MSGGAHLSHRRILAASAAVVIALSGCGDGESPAVDIDAPALSGTPARQCAALQRALPDQVANLWSRDVRTDGVAAAWGAPTIVLRCGVTDATGLGPAVRCDVIDGVGWFSEDLDDSYRFTTIGRSVPVELTVPHDYAPEADAAVDVAAAVKRAIPLQQPCV
ncbi:MAG TPA: DUF3515 family protein [Nocardioidaceae bacterium]|nr:DUF3515 family protein [Nocardioidaceae bacterium]